MNYKKRLAIGLICIQLLSFGCMKEPEAYSSMDMIEHAQEQEQKELENIRLTQREDMDKQYGNGLYFADLDEIRAEFNAKYLDYLQAYFQSKTNDTVIIEADITFYNQSLLDAKEGQLTFEEAVKDIGKHLRSYYLRIAVFTDGESYVQNAILDEDIMTFQRENVSQGISDSQVHLCIYDKSVLKQTSIEEIRDSESIYFYLDSYEKMVDMNYYFGIDSDHWSLIDQKWVDEVKEAYLESRSLKVLYLTPYVIPYSERDFLITGSYPRAVAKKIMVNRINQILEEEGVDGYICQYTAAVKASSNSHQDTFDVSVLEDELYFLREIYADEFDTNLVYLKKEGEEPDFEKLYQVYVKIMAIMEDHMEGVTRNHNVFVHFYNLKDESEYKIVTDLFKRDELKPISHHGKGGIENIYAEMYVTRANIDGFYYLDVYGEKKKYLMRWHKLNDETRKYSPEEKMKNSMRTGLFGGEYGYDEIMEELK